MSDDEDYKKAINQRAMELMGKEKDLTDKPPKRTRAKRQISEEQREKLVARLAVEREKAIAVRREKKAINDAIKKDMTQDYEEKKKKYLSNPPQEKASIKIDKEPSKEVKPQLVKEPQERKLLPPAPKAPQPTPPTPTPTPTPTPQPIKATYFRPTIKHYNKYGGSYQ